MKIAPYKQLQHAASQIYADTCRRFVAGEIDVQHCVHADAALRAAIAMYDDVAERTGHLTNREWAERWERRNRRRWHRLGLIRREGAAA